VTDVDSVGLPTVTGAKSLYDRFNYVEEKIRNQVQIDIEKMFQTKLKDLCHTSVDNSFKILEDNVHMQEHLLGKLSLNMIIKLSK